MSRKEFAMCKDKGLEKKEESTINLFGGQLDEEGMEEEMKDED